MEDEILYENDVQITDHKDPRALPLDMPVIESKQDIH